MLRKQVRLYLAVLLSGGLLVSAIPSWGAAASFVDSKSDNLNNSGTTHLPYYADVASKYPDRPGKETIEIQAAEGFWESSQGKKALEANDDWSINWNHEMETLVWEFEVNQEGQYILSLDYCVLGDSGNNAVRALTLDGETPFYEAENLAFSRKWQDQGDIKVNSIGDQVRPSVAEIKGWQKAVLKDSRGLYAEPLVFYLTAGVHRLGLTYVTQDMAIRTLTWSPYTPPPTYEEVYASYPKSTVKGIIRTFQAEDAMTVKNDPTIRLECHGDSAVVPRALGYSVLNTIGGWRWRKGNQSVTMEFEVPETGLYQIGLRYLQCWNDGLPSYRTIAIDGEVPFQELQAYRFQYSSDWQTEILGNNGSPYLFYLKAGLHTLDITVTVGEMRELVNLIYDDILLISDILQDINQLTGNNPDPNYDYEFFKFIPSLEGNLQKLAKNLKQKSTMIQQVASKTTSMGSNLKSIAAQLESMIRNPFSIASRVNQINQAQTSLGSWYNEIQNHPMQLDEFTLATPEQLIPHRKSTVLQKLWTAIKNFLMSFVKDYDNVASLVQDDVEIRDVINVWIARGTEWAEIVKELADEEFTPKTGILVNLNVVPASQLNTGSANALMLAITSGNAPDVAMGVAANSPVEFAIRDAVVDLSKFPDYERVRQRFLKNIMIAFSYEDGVYALPETMNFTALFYRKDILDKYDMKIPNTREELYNDLLPKLYQNGMLYYQNQDFTPFLFQHGGKYYSDDGYLSALDTTEAYRAFREYTEMFTNYSAPVSANFFNRFRTGEMPIGVGNYTLYIQLCTAAPELVGRWGIAPLPGIRQDDGSINRASGGLASECDIILDQTDSPEESWEFLNWWSSKETQIKYARELEALVGVEARWNTANIEAFLSLDWNRQDLSVFQEQWKWATEMPVVLGGYFTNRYINNAFNSVVVVGNKTPRDALEDAVKEINRELRTKQEEYGVFQNE